MLRGKLSKTIYYCTYVFTYVFSDAIFAASKVAKATDIAGLASNLALQFQSIGQLMIGTAYIAGIGFGIAAIFKFKQHKDNPTQVPIGTPFAMLAISVLLVFLPGLYSPAGKSIYGTTKKIGGGFQGGGADNIPGATK